MTKSRERVDPRAHADVASSICDQGDARRLTKGDEGNKVECGENIVWGTDAVCLPPRDEERAVRADLASGIRDQGDMRRLTKGGSEEHTESGENIVWSMDGSVSLRPRDE